MLLAFAGVGAPAAQRLAASTFPLQISVILVVVLVTSCIATGGGRGEEEEEVGNDWQRGRGTTTAAVPLLLRYGSEHMPLTCLFAKIAASVM